LYRQDQAGLTTQLTDLRRGKEPDEEKEPDAQDAFLEAQQEHLFNVIRQRKADRERQETAEERDEAARDLPPTFYVGDRAVEQLQIDPAERYVTFVLVEEP